MGSGLTGDDVFAKGYRSAKVSCQRLARMFEYWSKYWVTRTSRYRCRVGGKSRLVFYIAWHFVDLCKSDGNIAAGLRRPIANHRSVVLPGAESRV